MPYTSLINLQDLFKKGIFQDVIITDTEKKGPPTGKHWLVLNGYIVHIEATASGIVLTRRYTGNQPVAAIHGVRQVDAASKTGTYNFYTTTQEPVDSTMGDTLTKVALPYWILSDDDWLRGQFGAGGWVHLNVIEW